MTEPITTTEWLAEIERLQAQMDAQPEGLTSKQIKEILGVNEKKVADILTALHKQGRLIAQRKTVSNHYSGKTVWTIVYSIKQEADNG